MAFLLSRNCLINDRADPGSHVCLQLFFYQKTLFSLGPTVSCEPFREDVVRKEANQKLTFILLFAQRIFIEHLMCVSPY